MADAAVTVEVRGVEELERGSRELFDHIQDGAPRTFEGVADQVAGQVRATVPRLSGAMAASVVADRSDKGASVGYDGSAVYAGWVDFGGTRGRPYVPSGRFLFPVATQAGPLLEDAGGKLAADEIRRMRWPRA